MGQVSDTKFERERVKYSKRLKPDTIKLCCLTRRILQVLDTVIQTNFPFS